MTGDRTHVSVIRIYTDAKLPQDTAEAVVERACDYLNGQGFSTELASYLQVEDVDQDPPAPRPLIDVLFEEEGR